MSRECKKFFSDEGTPDEVPEDVEEIHIKKGSRSTYCYSKKNPENSKWGWCKTTGNYYNNKQQNRNMKGWGFCGKDCFTNHKQQDQGVLREKEHVSILDERLCEQYLNASLPEDVEVRPWILCVAKKAKWKEQVWKKTGESFVEEKETGKTKRFINI